jgi:hypothetical protein
VALAASSGQRQRPPSRDYDPNDEVKYRALFAILTRLLAEEQEQEQQQQQQQQQPSRFVAFARAQAAAALSVPFLCWLADLEASSPPRSPQKLALGNLCERLVALREEKEREEGGRLYEATLRALGRGDEDAAALVASDPRVYQAALSVALTGEAPPTGDDEDDEGIEVEDEEAEDGAVVVAADADLTAEPSSSSSRLSFGRLLRVAPPAALTPAGVAAGLAAAEELAGEARQRRRSSLAAVVGRSPLSAEAEASLLAGSVASRILDLLLGLGSTEERLGLLPDCFTPPSDGGGGGSAAAGGGGGGGDEAPAEEEQETEELWCTPLQLLVEVESRLRAVEGKGDGAAGVGLFGGTGVVAGAVVGAGSAEQPRGAIGSGVGARGTADPEALRELRTAIRSSWMEALPGGKD